MIDSRVVDLDQRALGHFAKGERYEGRPVRVAPLLGAKDGVDYGLDEIRSAPVQVRPHACSTNIAGRFA